LFKRSDTPLPFTDRKIDALLHQIYISPVLMTGRGPVANGVPVPCYTSDISSALMLVESEMPGREWGIERQSGRTYAWLSACSGRPHVRVAVEDHPDMPPASAVIAAMVESANENSNFIAANGCAGPWTMQMLAERAQKSEYAFGERLTLQEALCAPEPHCEALEAV
jgi:hypothetical protein